MRKSIQAVQAECERLRARMVDAEREKDRQYNRAEQAEAECERHRSERDVESRLNRDRVEALQSECDVAQDEARKATARADDAERRADNLRASHDYPRLQDVARIGELEAECERRRARERELVAALALADKVMADTVTEERRLLSEECERLRARESELVAALTSAGRHGDAATEQRRLLSEELERLQRALTAAYATSELFAAECLRWRAAHPPLPPIEIAAEDRSEPPPGYSVVYDGDYFRPELQNVADYVRRAQAVAACWAHRDAVLTGATAAEPNR